LRTGLTLRADGAGRTGNAALTDLAALPARTLLAERTLLAALALCSALASNALRTCFAWFSVFAVAHQRQPLVHQSGDLTAQLGDLGTQAGDDRLRLRLDQRALADPLLTLGRENLGQRFTKRLN